MEISKVAGLIHVVRGLRVILDEDLALLYGVPTKVLNQAVRRNLQRFPEDFMIALTRDEALVLRSQIDVLRKKGSGRGRKYWPLAFTEQGVAMLSGVLNSDRAVQVNIAIMRAFVRLRQALTTERDLPTRMQNAESAITEHDRELTEHAAQLNDAFAEIRRLRKS
ncbi:MAG: ORF6N domain-containing protein [Elusimicrobiota bacterium]